MPITVGTRVSTQSSSQPTHQPGPGHGLAVGLKRVGRVSHRLRSLLLRVQPLALLASVPRQTGPPSSPLAPPGPLSQPQSCSGPQCGGTEWASDSHCGRTDEIVYQRHRHLPTSQSDPVSVTTKPQHQDRQTDKTQDASHGTVSASQQSQQAAHLAGEEQDHHQHRGPPQQVQHHGQQAGQDREGVLLLLRNQLWGLLGDREPSEDQQDLLCDC